MAEKFTIQVEKREELGSSTARRLRRQNRVPAVMYGHGKAATPIILEAETVLALARHPGLVTVKVGSRRRSASAIVKEVQRDPITGQVLHMDLQEVKADEIITATLVIESRGEPAGHQSGGQLQQILHEIEVKCLPADMIEVLVVEVSAMELDETIHVRDLPLPEGITATADPERPVFQVRLPRIMAVGAEEAEVEEEAEAAEGPEGAETKEEPGEASTDARK